MNSKGRIAVVLGPVLIILALLLALHYASGGGGLKRYKAELRARGEKLTFVELAIPPSTNADEIACRDMFDTNKSIVQVNVPTLMESAGPGKAHLTWRWTLLLSPSAGRTNSTASTWEELDQQNAALAPVLADFRRVLEHPAPDAGWTYTNTLNTSKINWVRFRHVAQALVSDEIGALHRGEFEAARSDLHALVSLPQTYRNDPSFVCAMIRMAIAEQGLEATWEALPAPGWDEKTLSALQHDWEGVDLLGALERGLKGERALGSAVMETARKSDAQGFRNILFGGTVPARYSKGGGSAQRRLMDDLEMLVYKLTWADEDEFFMLKTESQAVEIARTFKEGHPWPEVHAAVTNLHAMVDHELGLPRGRRLMISCIAIPNFSRAYETTARVETRRRLAITAIAIERFRLRYGRPPEHLAALRPEFVAEVPIDPMSGKTLSYRLNADGTFVIYSVGEDGTDDPGSGRAILWPAVSTQ